MNKVKRKNLHGDKITRETTNEYKLGKYVKKISRGQIFLNGGDRHSQRGMGATDIH